MKVGFDTAPIALNRAGERRTTLGLLRALRARKDVGVEAIALSRRVPRSFAQRLIWQAAAEGLYYPMLVGRRARAAGVDLLHYPRHLVTPDFGVGVPRVVTVADALVLRMPEHFSLTIAKRYRVLARSIVRRADMIITPSRSSREDLVELLGVDPDRIRVTPWGVDDHFEPCAVDANEVAERFGFSAPFVLCLGTLEPRKNLIGAVRAFERVQADFPDHSLAIIGGRGWKSTEFERLLAGTSARIARTGYVDERDLPQLYSAADCFLFPSFGEGFGLPVLEAMACGTPVVTSDRTSLPEVAADAALLVDPASVEAIGSTLASVLGSSELRARLAEQGVERSRGFTWERCAEQTVDVYRELLVR